MKVVQLLRHLSCRTGDDVHTNNLLKVLINPALGEVRGWTCNQNKISQRQTIVDGAELWEYTWRLEFTKVTGQAEKEEAEWKRIYASIVNKGISNAYWNKWKWKIIGGDLPEGVTVDQPLVLVQDASEEEESTNIQGVHTVTTAKVITIEQMRDTFPHQLLGSNSDEEIANHPAFNRIFGRNHQIRALMSAVKSFLETDGKRSSHVCLDGPAGCGKTQLLKSLVSIWGDGCCLKLDATATSKAGVEKMFFDELPEIPPFCVMEEIEKCDESGLTVWLGALDDRKEIRKVNFRTQKVRRVNFLALCTSNNRQKFDKIMDGALSSRFKHKWLCPRPDRNILRMILQRDVNENGGNPDWVEPCLNLAEQIGTDDPRLVLAFLDGGDRLLDETYQKDILAIYANRPSDAPLLIQKEAA